MMNNKNVLSYALSCTFSIAASIAIVGLILIGVFKAISLMVDSVQPNYIGWLLATVSLVCFIGISLLRKTVEWVLLHKRYPSKAKGALAGYERALVLATILVWFAVASFGCLFLVPSIGKEEEGVIVIICVLLGVLVAVGLYLVATSFESVMYRAICQEVEKVAPGYKMRKCDVGEAIEEGFVLLERDGKLTSEGVFFCDDGEIRLNNPYHESDAFYHQQSAFKAKVKELLGVLANSPYKVKSVDVFAQKMRGDKEGRNYMPRFVAVVQAYGAQVYFTSDDDIGSQFVYHDESFNLAKWKRLQSRLEYYKPIELSL
ncbi:hypothetical protein [Alteromonas macleodii]|uniref:hypothetical protein n=1 Tax=Alteromonas macleodii TaxID=28108 RepID=UPI0031407BE8